MGTTSGVSGNVECSDSDSKCEKSSFGYSNLKKTSNVTIRDNAGNTSECEVPITAYCPSSYVSRCSAAGCQTYGGWYVVSTVRYCGDNGLCTGGAECRSYCEEHFGVPSTNFHLDELRYVGEYSKRECTDLAGSMSGEAGYSTSVCTNYARGCSLWNQNLSKCGCDAWHYK